MQRSISKRAANEVKQKASLLTRHCCRAALVYSRSRGNTRSKTITQLSAPPCRCGGTTARRWCVCVSKSHATSHAVFPPDDTLHDRFQMIDYCPLLPVYATESGTVYSAQQNNAGVKYLHTIHVIRWPISTEPCVGYWWYGRCVCLTDFCPWYARFADLAPSLPRRRRGHLS